MQHHNELFSQMGIYKPEDKLRILSNYSDAVEVNPNIPARRYYLSGLEMVRMAEVYEKDHAYENAYVLYMKYMTLFIEKIKKHPGYASVPSDIRSVNQAKLREIMTVAEKLKVKLLDQYRREYNLFVEDQKQKMRGEKLRQEQEARASISRPGGPVDKWNKETAIVQLPPSTNKITYNFDDEASAADLQISPTVSVATVPSFDRSTKPSLNSDISNAGLRSIHIPSEIINKFQMLARHNTMRNVETCGLIAGEFNSNQLIVTTLILPKQQGTSDSCQTLDEDRVFEYQDRLGLITMGWIHTHPTQTAFLSSVDLHTHCSYQWLLPEAVAIVCAPKYRETGFFSLTEYGLTFISQCRKSGFHPHPTEPPLYMNAGHIKMDDNQALAVKDFR